MNETNTTPATPATPAFSTLLDTILNAINTHINLQVEAKLNNVMQAHTTMKQIDESFKEAIEKIAMEKVQEHDEAVHHLTDDSVREIMDDVIVEQVRREVRDADISDQIYDAITDYDFDDKFDAYDFDDKIDEWKDRNDILDSDQVREMVEEILEEKLKEMLGKLSITIKEE